jgi:hypothetical protein
VPARRSPVASQGEGRLSFWPDTQGA